ncbi:hypothetical protein [Nocardia sp. CC201C]|uniref:hypothetical protein n=1 Tax=Nocardia sp. CC201C TaxID=3044575 RepID=UPI0032C09D9F
MPAGNESPDIHGHSSGPVAGSGIPEQRGRGDYDPDITRTTRHHAGESVQNSRNWPGLILIAIGLVALAGTLTAAAYSFPGWAIAAGVIAVLCLGFGIGAVTAEHRRVKSREGLRLSDQQGH